MNWRTFSPNPHTRGKSHHHHHCSTKSIRYNSCAFHLDVFTAVFNDCWLMQLDLNESLKSVVPLFFVSWHHLFLYILALLLNAAFIFFPISLFILLYSSPASVLEYFRCFSCHLWSQIQNTVCDPRLNLLFCLPRPLQQLSVAFLLDCLKGCLHWMDHKIWIRIFPI